MLRIVFIVFAVLLALLSGCARPNVFPTEPSALPSSVASAAEASGAIQAAETEKPSTSGATRISIQEAIRIPPDAKITDLGFASMKVKSVALEGISTRDMASWSSEAVFIAYGLDIKQAIFALDLERPTIKTFYTAENAYPELSGLSNNRYYTIWSERALDGRWRIVVYNRQKDSKTVLRKGDLLSDPEFLCKPTGNGEYTVWLEDAATGCQLMAYHAETQQLYTVAALPQIPRGELRCFGMYLAYALKTAEGYAIQVHNLLTGEQKNFLLDGAEELPLDAQYDGETLYFRTSDSALYSYETDGKTREISKSAGEYAVSAGLRQLFFVDGEEGRDAMNIYDPAGGKRASLVMESFTAVHLTDIQINLWDYLGVIVHDRGKNPAQVYTYMLYFAPTEG